MLDLNTTLCSTNRIGFDCGYTQRFDRYLKDTGEYHFKEIYFAFVELLFGGELEQLDDPEIRFIAVTAPPNFNCTRDSDGFIAAGPHFSVTYETAKYLNFR